ncbi:hypothetical protein Dimus_007110 [Dionaea muscipula]
MDARSREARLSAMSRVEKWPGGDSCIEPGGGRAWVGCSTTEPGETLRVPLFGSIRVGLGQKPGSAWAGGDEDHPLKKGGWGPIYRQRSSRARPGWMGLVE